MHALDSFHFYPFLDTLVSYVAAFICGTLIGAERQYRQRTAGLRTNALVALGAAAFVDLGQRLAGNAEAVRVIAYVVSGVGFLGAGVIMKEGMNIRGLNTAATLWCSAAVGACAGTDMLAEAVLLTGFVLAGNTLLRPLVNAINRIPITSENAEASYSVSLTSPLENADTLREMLIEHLETANYPISTTEFVERGDDSVEIVAHLISTAAKPKELDAIVDHFIARHDVEHATWAIATNS